MANSKSAIRALVDQFRPKKQWGIVSGTLWAIGAYLLPSGLLYLFVLLSRTKFDLDSIVVNFALQAVFMLITLLAITVVIYIYKRTLKDVGLTFPKLGDIARGVALYPIYFILAAVTLFFLSAFFPNINLEQSQLTGYEGASGWWLVLVFMGLVVIPPFVEEILFRGFLYKGYRRYLGIVMSTILVSGLFALAHGQLNVAIDTFVLSLILCGLREYTGNLWASITLHMLKNFTAFLLLFVFKVV